MGDLRKAKTTVGKTFKSRARDVARTANAIAPTGRR
jgi:hypothetical protein